MRRLPALVAAVALCSACATHQRTQTDPRLFDWANVLALFLDEPIEVATRDGRRLSGTTQSVYPQGIVLGSVAVVVRREPVMLDGHAFAPEVTADLLQSTASRE
jgi:hypothetical protein